MGILWKGAVSAGVAQSYVETVPFHTTLIPGNYPVDTGRKLNVHKAFRRRPGRLLNVLCTFNLPCVSKGLVKLRYFFQYM